MRHFRKKTALAVVLCITELFLAGCDTSGIPESSAISGSSNITVASSAQTPQTEATNNAPADHTSVQSSADTGNTIRPEPTTHKYNHKNEGYYNLLEDGVEFEPVPQLSGTCWVYAAFCALTTSFQRKQGKYFSPEHPDRERTVLPDQMELLNTIYSDDKEEGLMLARGTDKKQIGGNGLFVQNELARGFGEGLVLDDTIDARNWTMDEIKDGIRTYGALYIGIPDSNSTKGTYDHYHTMNHPDAEQHEFDHSIAVLGWDDHFPKEYFREKASRDGAWITYNSASPQDYYYVSYDTPFDQVLDPPLFMSMSDKYSKVLSYDCGLWYTEPIRTGMTTTTANIFHEKGTLAAVGTYTVEDNVDLTIEIMTPDLLTCTYSQKCHADRAGYHVFELDEPPEVDEYAIAVTYPQGAPVEGESLKLDNATRVETKCTEGQSFLLVEGKWLDMSHEQTRNILGQAPGNACIKALYID